MRGYLMLVFGLALVAEGSTTNESLIDIASRACQYSSFCTRDSVLTVPEGSDKASCCFPCSCSEDCLEFNNCCPDYKPPDNLPANLKTIPCKQANYIGNKRGRFYYIIDECPDGLQNTDMAMKCLGSTLNTISDISIIWSPSKRRIYQNRFCALCHGADDLVPWQPLTKDCTPFWPLDNLAQALALQRSLCEIYFEPSFDPSVLDHLTCFDTSNIIDSCQGPLGQDAVIQMACDSGPFLPYAHYVGPDSEFDFYSMFYSNALMIFKNAFCFLCNKVPSNANPLCYPLSNLASNSRDNMFLSLTIMLNLQLMQETRPRVCGSDEMFDGLTGGCRKIHCQDFDVAIDGTCVSQIVKTYGLPVQVAFKLTPSTPSSASIPPALPYEGEVVFYKELVDAITSLVDALLDRGCGQCGTLFYEETDPITSSLVAFHVEVVLHTSDSCSALDIRKHRNTLEEDMQIKIAFENQVLEYQSRITFESHNISFPDYTQKYTLCRAAESKVIDDFYCPYIEMDLADYAVALDQGLIEGNKTFCSSDSSTNSSCDSETVKRICLSDYKNPEVSYQTQSRLTDALNVSGIVSFVSTVLSVLSLLTTIFTYSCFRSLRQLPSGIILLLSVNLLLSQLLYAFGLGRTEIHWLCFGFGVAIHYFVLAYVLTMNAYMLLVYKTLRSNSLQVIGKAVYVIVVYIYILPLMLIGVNVGVSFHTSVGTSFGYGDEYCFISTADMRRYVFAVPIFLAVCCNCCVYGLTVRQIYSVTETLPSDIQERRSNQWVYFRLSMLTGISWLFGFIHEVSGDPFSEYSFIVLNAGQGVFVMICFVCKRRIFDLYKQSFGSMMTTDT